MSELLEIGCFLPVKKKDELNRQIIVIRVAAHSPSKHKQNDVFKIGLMLLDFLLFNDPQIAIYGTRAIFDLKGIQFGHAYQMTPTIIKRAVQTMEDYPVRIQKMEFVNSNRGINVILDVFRSFMTTKMKERITVSRINPEYKESDSLPKELGGSGESYDELRKYWKATLEKNYQWFSSGNESYGCN
jgi:hypothetical protein